MTQPQIPSAESVRRERDRLAEIYRHEAANGIVWPDSTATITDPVMTPFVRAMRAEGYSPLMKRQCAVLDDCHDCKQGAIWTFSKGEQTLKLCAWCNGKKYEQ